MRSIKIIGYSIGLFFLLAGCDSVDTSTKHEKNVGYFVTVFKSSIDYNCENQRKKLDDSGKFECGSFPITFYMDDQKLGEIDNIHKDGYVYPQDVIFLEEQSPVYSSDNSMSFLTIE